MFLLDRGGGLVFHWGKRTQWGTGLHQVCSLPSHNKTLPSKCLMGKKQQGNNTEIHLSIWLTSYLLFARVDRNYQADMGFPYYCQWGLEMLRPSDKETLLRTGPMAQPDPRMHKTDQLDTLGTQLQTKIDSTDLSPDSKTSYTSGEITQPGPQMLEHCCKFQSLWSKSKTA